MDIQLAPAMSSESPGIVEPIYLHLSVIDLETIAALSEASEGRDRQELALTALRIGILSLKAARGTVDGAAIRQEGDRFLGTFEERLCKRRELMDEALGGTLRSYFDPASGAFTERVQRLLRHDGELAMVIGAQVDAARRTLDELLAQHLGDESPLHTLLSPEEGNTFIRRRVQAHQYGAEDRRAQLRRGQRAGSSEDRAEQGSPARACRHRTVGPGPFRDTGRSAAPVCRQPDRRRRPLSGPRAAAAGVSRAKCLAIVIANPALTAIKCHTPEQMALVSTLCRVAESGRLE